MKAVAGHLKNMLNQFKFVKPPPLMNMLNHLKLVETPPLMNLPKQLKLSRWEGAFF